MLNCLMLWWQQEFVRVSVFTANGCVALFRGSISPVQRGSPDSRVKCWQLPSLQTTEILIFVCVLGYISTITVPISSCVLVIKNLTFLTRNLDIPSCVCGVKAGCHWRDLRTSSPVFVPTTTCLIATRNVRQPRFRKTTEKSKLERSIMWQLYVCLGWIFLFSLVTTLCSC